MTVHDTKLSRRTLLKGGAGLVLGAYVARADKLFAQAP
ncbi:MAG: Twin-arginine translocation pathway signal, partial [Tardiphaga sp.]|nr:Twin-arginine translocation pathway signal [Tardiphaga sp.]